MTARDSASLSFPDTLMKLIAVRSLEKNGRSRKIFGIFLYFVLSASTGVNFKSLPC